MAIYTGGMRMQDEARAAGKRVAAQQRKAEEGEAKRKGRAGMFGKLGGMALGTLAVGLTGLTGGLAAPLVMGIASSLGKKWADEASKGGSKWSGDLFKTPGQVDEIDAGGEFGFGREEAAETTKALEKSRKTEFGADTMLGDIAGSYLSAGLSGGLSAGAKTLSSGEAGSIAKAFGGQGSATGWEGVKQAAGYGIEGLEEGGEGDFASFLESTKTEEEVLSGTEYLNEPADLWAETDPTAPVIYKEQGGQVMDQNTMIGLALLSQMQQQQEQTAYSGTVLDGISTGSVKKEQPSLTLSDYFKSQGKTPGGNNTQSIAQKVQIMGK